MIIDLGHIFDDAGLVESCIGIPVIEDRLGVLKPIWGCKRLMFGLRLWTVGSRSARRGMAWKILPAGKKNEMTSNVGGKEKEKSTPIVIGTVGSYQV